MQIKAGLEEGGLVFKTHILVYYSILGWRVLEERKKKKKGAGVTCTMPVAWVKWVRGSSSERQD